MKNNKISIIVPVYNEEKLIKDCLDALIDLDYPKEDYEIVVVNDGSKDRTLESIKGKQDEAKEKNVVIRIVNLEKNQGRVIAIETGVKNAKYNNIQLFGARCLAHKDVLKNINTINYQPIVGNPIIDYNRSSSDRFNWLFRKKLYGRYFEEHFEPIFITKNNFDNIGKGSFLFCDKELFLSSQPDNKSKNASDDTKLLWNIVQKKNLLKHPDVKTTYQARTSFKSIIKHIFERGPKFVDYYLSPEKKYFWIFIFLPILASIFTMSLIFINITYFLYWLIFLLLILILISIWLAENIKDFFIVLGFLPIFGLSFELGILNGLLLKIAARFNK